MDQYDINAHIEKIRAIYREKLNLMCDLIDSELGDFVKYVRPEGGLFVWCELPENVDMLEFVRECINEKVAVVPGTAFMINDEATNCFRLNFSTPSNEKIVEGMKALGRVKAKFIK
jgi:2-aminoadipate transaminase